MRGISFQPDMVQAIAEGRKTQTRRMISNWPHKVGEVLYVKEQWWKRRSLASLFSPIPNINEEKWRRQPAMFMPRKLTRYYIKITAVRTQRVQEITEVEAQAEGMTTLMSNGKTGYCDVFKIVWHSLYPPAPKEMCPHPRSPDDNVAPIYRKRKHQKKWDYAWHLNPEVQVYEFVREEKL